MPVIVLYEQGLEDAAAELEKMGYRMHPMRSRLPADAVLYVSDAHAALCASCGRHGAPILCVRAMSAAQMASAIRRRSEQPLF